MPRVTYSPNGKLTFAIIDGPNDKWFWAIVKDYKNPQEYGQIIMGFEDGFEPCPYDLAIILELLERNISNCGA